MLLVIDPVVAAVISGISGSTHLIPQHSPLQLYQHCMRLVSFTHFLPPSWTSASWKISFISPLMGETEDNNNTSTSTSSSSSSSSGRDNRRACAAPETLHQQQSPSRHYPYNPSLQQRQYHQHQQQQQQQQQQEQENGPPRLSSSSSRSAAPSPLFLGSDATQHGAFHSVSTQHRRVMRDLCRSLYSLRVVCMLDELAAVLLAPFLLYFYLPSVADDICDCIFASTVATPFGDLCCFSSLDVAAYGSPDYTPRSLQQQQQQQETDEGAEGDPEGHTSRGLSVSLPSDGEEGWGVTGGVVGGPRGGPSLSPSRIHRGAPTPRWRHLAPTVDGPPGGAPYVPSLQRFMPTNGKLEKSALSFLLTYRIAAPYDDTSPLWAVLASRRITRTLMAASARSKEIAEINKGSLSPSLSLSASLKLAESLSLCVSSFSLSPPLAVSLFLSFSLSMSLSISVSLSVSLSVSHLCWVLSLSVFLSLSLSLCLSLSLPACLSVSLCLSVSASLSVSLSLPPSLSVSHLCWVLSLSLSLCLPLSISVSLSVCLLSVSLSFYLPVFLLVVYC